MKIDNFDAVGSLISQAGGIGDRKAVAVITKVMTESQVDAQAGPACFRLILSGLTVAPGDKLTFSVTDGTIIDVDKAVNETQLVKLDKVKGGQGSATRIIDRV